MVLVVHVVSCRTQLPLDSFRSFGNHPFSQGFSAFPFSHTFTSIRLDLPWRELHVETIFFWAFALRTVRHPTLLSFLSAS